MLGALLHISGHMTAGDIVVGAGTLGLAAITWWLARQTKRDVDVSEKNIELTKESIAAQDMPYVIASPHERRRDAIAFEGDGHQRVLLYRLWNIGKGAAIVGDVQLTLNDGRVVLAAPAHEHVIHHLMPGADIEGTLSSRRFDEEYAADAALAGELRIYYRHADGEKYMTVSPIVFQNGRGICAGYTRRQSDDRERQVQGGPPPEPPGPLVAVVPRS